MNRRHFLGTLGFFAAPLAAEAQNKKRISTGGFLGSTAPVPEWTSALELGLRDLGWLKGQILNIEYRFASAGNERRQARVGARLLRGMARRRKVTGEPARYGPAPVGPLGSCPKGRRSWSQTWKHRTCI